MIISASRRTDIPNYYSDWFINRIREGYLYVRNPLNYHQISRINISPEIVDCIVFWTKNPQNILSKLKQIEPYKYYFQFTLTGYGKDIEPNIPDKNKTIIPLFIKLSKKIGKEKVIWRYDPIFINNKYTIEYHLKAFKKIAVALKNYTEKVVISFIDIYTKNKTEFKKNCIKEITLKDIKIIAEGMSNIARENNLEIVSCAEKYDLSEFGIVHNNCIDKKLIEKIIDNKLNVKKDKTQRLECGCVESIDVGLYNTCKNNCKYCYANYSNKIVESNYLLYDVNSPLLCGCVGDMDKIYVRKVRSNIDRNVSIFDFL